MFTILHAFGMFVADLFKSRTRLEAENLFLRHQLNIALRRAPPRLRLRGSDRALLILMTMLWPRLLGADLHETLAVCTSNSREVTSVSDRHEPAAGLRWSASSTS